MRIGPWSSKEMYRAVNLILKGGKSFSEVDEILGRQNGCTYQKLRYNGVGSEVFDQCREASAMATRRKAGEGRERRKRAHRPTLKPLRPEPGGGRDVPYVRPELRFVPRERLEERERAFAGEPTLSQALFGDPPRGRSALDRMGRP